MKKDVLAFGGQFLFFLLQFALFILKRNEVINWSWWLVMLPTLILIGIAVLLFVWLVVLVILRKRNRAKIEKLKKEAKEKKYF